MTHHAERNEIDSLKKEIEQLKIVIDEFPVAKVMVDTNGNIVSVNKNTRDLFGYTKEELIGQKVEILIPERFRSKHVSFRKYFVEHPVVRPMGIGRELYALHKDRTEFPVEIGLVPIKTSEGEFVIAAIVDITERKNNEMLWRSNQELEQFAYIASHDLQAPLRHIASYTQLLANKYALTEDSVTQAWVNFILRGCVRMSAVIEDLLTYSRVTKTNIKLELTNLNEVMKDMLEILKIPRENAKAEITWANLPTVYCSRMHMEQVFVNLIENAIKFQKNGVSPIVNIEAIPAEDGWTFFVKDNGIGVPQEYHDRIFQVFQRLEIKKNVVGTGIGLGIVKKIIELHGGKIWVISKPGEGTTFAFTLKGNRQ